MGKKNTDSSKKEITSNREIHRKAVKNRVKILGLVTITSLFVTFAAVIFCIFIWLYFSNKSADIVEMADETSENSDEKIYSQSEVDELVDEAEQEGASEASQSLLDKIEEQLENGTSLMGMVRSLYSEKIVVYDSNKYYFIPIDSSLAANSYVDDDFQTDDNGRVTYSEDGTVVTHTGIDVSVFQGDIDWDAVKDAGVEYAIIRAGIRGYSTGKIVVDENCQENIEGALASGLKVGVYFFSQAVSEEEAEEEAQCVIDMIQDYDITYPVYLDIEKVESSNCRTADLSVADRTTYAKAFLKTIQDAGYTAGIYGNLKTFTLLLDLTQLEDYPKWLASYSLPVYYPYDFDALQYTEEGTVDGIDEKVDLNISFVDYSSQE